MSHPLLLLYEVKMITKTFVMYLSEEEEEEEEQEEVVVQAMRQLLVVDLLLPCLHPYDKLSLVRGGTLHLF